MRKPSTAVKYGAFLISPFVAFLISLTDLKSRSSRIVIFGFFVLFGLTFNPVSEAADSFRYANEFKWFSIDPMVSLVKVYNIYTEHEGVVDGMVVKDLWVYVMYYISSVLGGHNVHVLFGLVAVVFAFFCLKSLKYITSSQYFSGNVFMFILAFLFLYTNNIQNINGVRFWTASWIAVYITFIAIVDKKLWCALWLLPLPLMHGSFVLYWGFFVGAYLLRKRLNFLFFFFLFSFFISEVTIDLIDSVENHLPGFLQSEVNAYVHSDLGQAKISGELQAGSPLYVKVFTALPRLFELYLVYLLALKRNSLRNKRFVGFVIAYFCLVNILAFVPTIRRYYIVGWPFVIYLWVTEWPVMKRYKKVLYLAPLAYCYHIFLWLRFVIPTTQHILYWSNPFHIIYHNLFVPA